MGRRKKNVEEKPLKSIKYHKEQHHTCTNAQICNKVKNPCELCKGCKYYNFRVVDVADNPIRHNIDWWNS